MVGVQTDTDQMGDIVQCLYSVDNTVCFNRDGYSFHEVPCFHVGDSWTPSLSFTATWIEQKRIVVLSSSLRTDAL